jgi:uncharacterized HAD superfamily protein
LQIALAAADVPIPVLLFDRPWNQAELPPGVTRVTDWDQALRVIGAQAAARTG